MKTIIALLLLSGCALDVNGTQTSAAEDCAPRHQRELSSRFGERTHHGAGLALPRGGDDHRESHRRPDVRPGISRLLRNLARAGRVRAVRLLVRVPPQVLGVELYVRGWRMRGSRSSSTADEHCRNDPGLGRSCGVRCSTRQCLLAQFLTMHGFSDFVVGRLTVHTCDGTVPGISPSTWRRSRRPSTSVNTQNWKRGTHERRKRLQLRRKRAVGRPPRTGVPSVRAARRPGRPGRNPRRSRSPAPRWRPVHRIRHR